MASGNSIQYLFNSIKGEQVGYFIRDIYPKPALCQKIQQTKDLRKQLELINTYIRSLVTYPYEGHVYLEHNIDRQDLIFCVCKKCKEKFTLKKHKIFLEEREKEFYRIQKQINKLGTYTKKLNYLFQIKPFNLKRFTLQLFNNTESEKEKLNPYLSIDLYPKTFKEKEQAIHLIKDYVIEANQKEDPKLLDYKRRSPIALLDHLKEDFQQRLQQCLNPSELIEKEINLIHKCFRYSSKSYMPYITDGRHREMFEDLIATYNYLADGFTIKYDHIYPEVDTIIRVIKAEQAFAYTKYLQSLLQIKEENVESVSCNKEFTTARQVLALHYILKYCKVDNVDQSKKAAFIHFVTGKNKKNVYDLTRSPLSTKTKQFRKKDLQFIRSYFEDLKMEGVIKIINNELAKLDD